MQALNLDLGFRVFGCKGSFPNCMRAWGLQEGLGLRVEGVGFRVSGSGFKVLGFRA